MKLAHFFFMDHTSNSHTQTQPPWTRTDMLMVTSIQRQFRCLNWCCLVCGSVRLCRGTLLFPLAGLTTNTTQKAKRMFSEIRHFQKWKYHHVISKRQGKTSFQKTTPPGHDCSYDCRCMCTCLVIGTCMIRRAGVWLLAIKSVWFCVRVAVCGWHMGGPSVVRRAGKCVYAVPWVFIWLVVHVHVFGYRHVHDSPCWSVILGH